MKTLLQIKRIFATLILVAIATISWADAVEIDGIYYNLVSKVKTAEVTSKPSKYTGNITIPKTVIYEGVEYNVTAIGDRTFENCSSLTAITIHDGVTSIGDFAFWKCSRLTSITIPNGVTSIGDYTFAYCSNLTSVSIPNSVTKIVDGAFSCCSHLTSITIPASVTSIGEYAFNRCDYLKSIIIPNSVTSIGKGAFQFCSSLKSVIIGNGVMSIGESAFSGCSGLTKAEFASIESLCKISFKNPTSNSLYYAKHLYISGQEVKDLAIPTSVTSIGNYAFYNCSDITSVTIGSGVTSIGNYAFYNCSAFTSVTISNSVTWIGGYAFSDCSSLTSVTFGNGIASISGRAFTNCQELANVYCYAEKVPTMGSDVFEKSYVDFATLHVPESTVDSYKAAAQWKDFGTIVGFDPTGVEELKASNKSEAKVDKNAPIYDLNGRRLTEKPANGYYIQGGKKYLVE